MVTLQKVIRTISHNGYYEPTNNLFYCLNILKCLDVIKYKNYILSYKAFNTMLPIIVNNMFEVKNSHYNLRYENIFITIQCKSNMLFLNAISTAIRQWNSLPQNLRIVNSLDVFKKHIKLMLIYNYK